MGSIFARTELAKRVDRAVFPGTQGGPLMHVVAAKAVALLEAQSSDFREAQRRTVENAAALAETLLASGTRLVSGGTDNHLILVDVTPLGVNGTEAEQLLDAVGITVNKNAIPFDPLPPNTASGIRVGTPATSTRGFGVDEMRLIGELIVSALRGRDDPAVLEDVRRSVRGILRALSRSGADCRVNFEGLPFFLAAGVVAAVVAYFLTPLAMRFATASGAIDEPDSGRRIHIRPIPRAGGLAVALSFVCIGIAAIVINDRLQFFRGFPFRVDGNELVAVFGGAIVAAVFGFIDDKWQIRARWQFAFQLVLAIFAVALGLSILEINNPLDFLGMLGADKLTFAGVGAGIITALWIVGMINSINFIDGLDGLSTGVAIIAALTLGFVSLGYESSYQPMVALLCALLAGALLGYLPWNFNPARVFIGTTGVMVVGYLLAVLSILGSAKIAVALLILGVPIIDTFWIITRRLLSGHSPFTPDRGHFHHRLLDLGLSHKGAVVLIYGITIALAVLSLLLAEGSGPLYAFMTVVIASGLGLLLLTFRVGPDEALEATTYEADIESAGIDGAEDKPDASA